MFGRSTVWRNVCRQRHEVEELGIVQRKLVRAGSRANCPAGIDAVADAEQSVDAIFVTIDPGRLALAAAEDAALEVQLRALAGYGRPFSILPAPWHRRAQTDIRTGVFWNEVASGFIAGLVARHTLEFERRTRGVLGKDVFTRLRDYVIAHIDEPIEVSTLEDSGAQPVPFTWLLTRFVGVSPHRYVVHLRWQRAVEGSDE